MLVDVNRQMISKFALSGCLESLMRHCVSWVLHTFPCCPKATNPPTFCCLSLNANLSSLQTLFQVTYLANRSGRLGHLLETTTR